MTVRVGIDATPLAGQRTGVGRYVHRLVAALHELPGLDLTATAFTVRGIDQVAAALPPTVRTVSRPVPARLLRRSWVRGGPPPVEWLCGDVQVFHGTNFVLPPRRRAAGVLTVHDLGFLRFPETVEAANQVYRGLVPRGVREAAVTLTPSDTVRAEVLAEFGLDPARVVTTPLGVDEGWFEVGEAPLVERDGLHDGGGSVPPYVLFVGSTEPRKGLPTVVEALRRCRPGSAPRLVLAGPAGWGPALQAPPSVDVVRTGYLGDQGLRSTVRGAAAVVLPTRYEGFGLPVLEGLAAGVPVLASDLPVLREVGGGLVTHLPVGDPDAWAAALEGAVEARDHHDPGPGRAWARRWTWGACAEATRAAYTRAALDG